MWRVRESNDERKYVLSYRDTIESLIGGLKTGVEQRWFDESKDVSLYSGSR